MSPRLIIGVPLNKTFGDGFQASRFGGESFRGRRSQYLAGGGIETPLWRQFRLGVSVLYQRVSYDSSTNTRTTGVPIIIVAASSAAADRWQVPALAYYTSNRLLSPLFGTGVNLSLIGRVRGRTEGSEFPPTGPSSTFVRGPSDALPRRAGLGWCSAVGIKVGTGSLQLRPELLYTLWVRGHTTQFSGLEFRQHQLDLILGLQF